MSSTVTASLHRTRQEPYIHGTLLQHTSGDTAGEKSERDSEMCTKKYAAEGEPYEGRTTFFFLSVKYRLEQQSEREQQKAR